MSGAIKLLIHLTSYTTSTGFLQDTPVISS